MSINDDPRLSALIKEGDHGDIVLVGVPFDFFRKRTIQKGGEDNGPCCIRRFYPKVGALINREFDADISPISITDMGNIKIEIDDEEERERFKNVKTKRFKGEYVNYEKQSPERIVQHIADVIEQITRNNKLPFVFGGSKESTLGCFISFNRIHQENGRCIFLSGRPFLRRPYDGNKGTSDNILRIITDKFPNLQVTVFGPSIQFFPTQNTQVSSQTHQIVPKPIKNVNFVLLPEIRSCHKNIQFAETTQGIAKFKQVYHPEKPTHISISLEVICRFLGCRDVSSKGLENQEVCEIMFFLGKQSNIVSIQITQFNPSCEDYESSLVILNFLYYFLMGRVKR